MDRREFLLSVVALAAPTLSVAQPRARKIGLLTAEDLSSFQRDAFRAAFAERGWIEGSNLHVETRSAIGDPARMPVLAAELARLDVELIVTVGTIAAVAAKQATRRIPIVAYGVADPIGSGLAQSLGRPGGNVTGNLISVPILAVKRIEIVRELFPAGTRIGILLNPANPISASVKAAEETAGTATGLQLLHADVTNEVDVEAAVADVARRGARAVIINSDPIFAAPANSARMMSAVRRAKLVAIIDGDADREPVIAAFGLDWLEFDRQLASLVDRILKGANPAMLAIEQPGRYRFALNLIVARQHGITVPQSLLVRADQVFR